MSIRIGNSTSRLPAVILAMMVVAFSQPVAAQEIAPKQSVHDRPRPTYDPLGIRIGVFEIDAGLGVGIEYSDNILAASQNETDDVMLVLGSSVNILANWGRTALVVSADMSVGRHNDFSSEDFDDYTIRLIGRRRVGSDSLLRLVGRTESGHDSRRVPTEEDGLEPNEYSIHSIRLGLAGALGALDLDLDLKSENIDYEDAPALNGIINNDHLDRRENELRLRIGLFSQRVVSPVLQLNVDERNYVQTVDDLGISRSSDGSAVGVGVRLNQLGTLSGEVILGRIERNYKNDQLGDTDRFWTQSLLEWNPTRLTTLTLQYETRIDETTLANTAGIEVDALGITIDHELLRNLIVSLGVRSQQEDYVASARDDDISLWSAEATYFINTHLRVSFEFESYALNSSVPSQSFDENLFRFVLRAAL